MTGRLYKILFAFTFLGWVVAQVATVDLFALDGKRLGYIVVNEQTGTVDVFVPDGRRLGWGQVRGGRLDLFDKQGRRLPITGTVNERRTGR